MITNSQFKAITADYEKIQNKNRHILLQRKEEIYARIPAYQELEQQISGLCIIQGRKLLSGDKQALDDMKKQLHALSAQKQQLLKEHGYPADYLEPVYEQLHRELLAKEVLHADETTLQVLHEPGKEPQSKSYMWLYRTSGDTDNPVVMYEYQSGRGAVHPREFLEGFKGYLHADGYAGYHNLPEDITVVGCWAHLRRKFDEAMKSLPKSKAKNSSAAQGLAYCSLLFGLEDDFAELTPDERYQQRLEQAKPVLDAFLAWANIRNAAPKSALGKALTYLKEQWPYLTNYLKDGRMELSNNRAERSIKPFVIDRKNFLFANTPGGAKGSVVIFTMIQTAIENHLDPYRYLTWLLKAANTADLPRPEVIEQLLPWNAPQECRMN